MRNLPMVPTPTAAAHGGVRTRIWNIGAGARTCLQLWFAAMVSFDVGAASLGGRVSNEVDDSPIAGATITVLRVPFALAGNAVTDGSGVFSLGGLSAGSYIAFTEPAGFSSETYNNLPGLNISSATLIVLAAAETRSDIDFAVVPLYTMSGTVTVAGGGAVDGAAVFVEGLNGSPSGNTSSNAMGQFALQVPAGEYRLRVGSDGGLLGEFSDGTPCTLLACDATGVETFVVTTSDLPGIDFEVSRGGRISGQLSDAVRGGAPIQALQVNVYQGDGSVVAALATVSPEGSWQTEAGLPSASYRAIAFSNSGAEYLAQVYNGHDCAGPTDAACDLPGGNLIAVIAGATTTAVDFALTPTTGAVSGLVTEFAGGAPIADVRVVLTTGIGGGAQFETLTAADGSFRLDGVAPGNYVVRAEPDAPFALEYFPNIQCFNFVTCQNTVPPQSIAVSAGDNAANIEFALAPIATVAVSLRNVDTAQLVAGQLLVEVHGALSSSPFPISAEAFAVPVPSGGTLRFAGTSVQCGAGADQVCLGRLYPNLACPNLQCRFTPGAVVNVIKGQDIVGIELELGIAATIAGELTASADGLPLSGVVIEATSGNLTIAGDISDTNGDYELTGLGAGPYAIRTLNSGALIDELYDNVSCPLGNCLLADATLLQPLPGSRIDNVDFALAAGARIGGEVRSALGNLALGGAQVTVFNDAGIQVANLITAGNGSFQTGALPSGRYFLRASEAHHRSELFDGIACTATACNPLGATPIDLEAPIDRSDIVFALEADPNNLPPPTLVYINRCATGCTVNPGNNNSANNTSSIVSSAGTLTPFPHGDLRFEELVACLKRVFAPFNISVTANDPGNQAHHENMVAGLPNQLGFGNGTGGVSPFICGVVNNSITFTFAAVYDGNLIDLCHTSAMEIAHSFGLEHEFNCEDPMTYLSGCGEKRFTDVTVPCGEFGPRACQCGGTTQNSFQALIAAVGPKLLLFDDGFESNTAFLRMQEEYAKGMREGKFLQRDHCATHPD